MFSLLCHIVLYVHNVFLMLLSMFFPRGMVAEYPGELQNFENLGSDSLLKNSLDVP